MDGNSKIFIGGLSYSTSEEMLLAKLQEFGEVLSLRIVVDRESGKSKGYGFATMGSPQKAQKVISELGDTMFDGRRIGVKPSLRPNR